MRYTKTVKTNVFTLLLLVAAFPTHGTVITNGCGGNPSCTLDELFLGGSIQVNDVLFDTWVFNFNDGGILDETTVVISGFDEVADPTDSSKAFVGLEFTANPAISFDFLEYDFDFNVSISVSTRTLTQVALNLINSTIIDDAFVEINGDLGAAGLLTVDNDNISPVGSDAETLAGLTSLTVDADIQMEASGNGGLPTLGQFNYRFQVMSSQPPNVPEPPLLALVGVGLFSMLFSRRRKFD